MCTCSRADIIRYVRDHSTTVPEMNTNIFFTGMQFIWVDLSKLQLRRAIFDGCTFINCMFTKSMLQEVSFQHCHFEDCEFEGADAGTGIRVVGATFMKVAFAHIRGNWRFTDCAFVEADFRFVNSGASIIFDDETTLTACNGLDDVAHSDEHDAMFRSHPEGTYTYWTGPVS